MYCTPSSRQMEEATSEHLVAFLSFKPELHNFFPQLPMDKM